MLFSFSFCSSISCPSTIKKMTLSSVLFFPLSFSIVSTGSYLFGRVFHDYPNLIILISDVWALEISVDIFFIEGKNSTPAVILFFLILV